jgi:hypothetical protein
VAVDSLASVRAHAPALTRAATARDRASTAVASVRPRLAPPATPADDDTSAAPQTFTTPDGRAVTVRVPGIAWRIITLQDARHDADSVHSAELARENAALRVAADSALAADSLRQSEAVELRVALRTTAAKAATRERRAYWRGVKTTGGAVLGLATVGVAWRAFGPH